MRCGRKGVHQVEGWRRGLIYELAGPLMTKMALTAAGEIKPKPELVRGQGVSNPRKQNAP